MVDAGSPTLRYAPEMERHIWEGRKPERKEIELIVGLAATVAS